MRAALSRGDRMMVMEALMTLDYDVLVELSTLNIAEKG